MTIDKTGWANKCYRTKEEWALKCRNYRIANRERVREYNREYNRKWRLKYGYHNEINSNKRYPEKERARRIFNVAVRTGLIKRGKCQTCGKPKAHGHHDDYSKPLEVKWFCPLHHRQYEIQQVQLHK